MELSRIQPGSRREIILLARCAVLSCLALVLDQITKSVIVDKVDYAITVIPGFFNIVKVGNKGAAWGMFYGYTWALLGVSTLFLVGVVFFLRSLTEGYWERYYALSLVVGGVLGNSIDRIWRGGTVVDFLDFYISGYPHWPAFNVADSAIFVGVATYIISSMKREGDKKKEHG
ncbi:MAG: signal peptidase II [Kiritimatiellaeota bacterium]|nr:signal peptidase II [Kiritimatiellota bacterium]